MKRTKETREAHKRSLILDSVNPHTGKVLKNVKSTPVLEYWVSKRKNAKTTMASWYALGCEAALGGYALKPESKTNQENFLKGYNRYKRKEENNG